MQGGKITVSLDKCSSLEMILDLERSDELQPGSVNIHNGLYIGHDSLTFHPL